MPAATIKPVRDADHDEDELAWHERTSTVVGGASIGAIAVIGVLYLLISYMVGGSDEPGNSPQYYPDPSFSERTSAATTSTTSTETITSTSPPLTTDINPRRHDDQQHRHDLVHTDHHVVRPVQPPEDQDVVDLR